MRPVTAVHDSVSHRPRVPSTAIPQHGSDERQSRATQDTSSSSTTGSKAGHAYERRVLAKLARRAGIARKQPRGAGPQQLQKRYDPFVHRKQVRCQPGTGAKVGRHARLQSILALHRCQHSSYRNEQRHIVAAGRKTSRQSKCTADASGARGTKGEMPSFAAAISSSSRTVKQMPDTTLRT